MSEPPRTGPPREIAQELIDAFVRLARADFTVRLPRNYTRDSEDVLALFVNLIAEELDRLLSARENTHRALEEGVTHLSEQFVALAAGNFEARAPRTGKGDPLDVLAFLFNNTVAEVGEAFGELDKQRVVLEAILESMIDGVLLLDAAGVMRRANGAIARLLGRDASGLVGRPLAHILAPEEHDLTERLPSLVSQGPFHAREVLFCTSTGELVTMTVNGSPQRNTEGALVGVVLVARDDRDLKKARAQLQMTDRLASMGTVAAGVAHEINNPLAFVSGNLDFLAEELASKEGRALPEGRFDEVLRALRASQGGAERMRGIVRDLKAFSRIDQEVVGRVDINRLLDSAVGMIRNELRHHAKLVKAYGKIPPVLGNEARLLQVFLNLLQNAAQSIPVGNVANNEIRIVTRTSSSGDVVVELHDSGCGISEENLPRIFDAFFTTKATGIGTGLGLSICHKIVTSLGGRLEVTSKPGAGSTFLVTLPAATEAVSEGAREEAPAPRATSRRTILVVDDESEVGASIERMLGREHEVVSVTRGAAALVLLARRPYDFVLCDLMMPEMTGIELYQRLRATDPAQAERVVFISAGTFDPSVRAFLENVKNPCIDKPFGIQTLRALLAMELG